MPEDISVNEELGIIEVHSYGDVTKETLETSIKKVLEIHNEKGINHVLVDTTGQDVMPGTVTIYDFAVNLPHSIAFAIVVTEKQPTKPEQDFFETVAHNRGFEVGKFLSREEALDWFKTLA